MCFHRSCWATSEAFQSHSRLKWSWWSAAHSRTSCCPWSAFCGDLNSWIKLKWMYVCIYNNGTLQQIIGDTPYPKTTWGATGLKLTCVWSRILFHLWKMGSMHLHNCKSFFSSCSITLNVYPESVRIKTCIDQSDLTSFHREGRQSSTWPALWSVCDKTVPFHGLLTGVCMAQSSLMKLCVTEKCNEKTKVEEYFSSLSKTDTLCQNRVQQCSQLSAQWCVQFSSLHPLWPINWSLSFLLI